VNAEVERKGAAAKPLPPRAPSPGLLRGCLAGAVRFSRPFLGCGRWGCAGAPRGGGIRGAQCVNRRSTCETPLRHALRGWWSFPWRSSGSPSSSTERNGPGGAQSPSGRTSPRHGQGGAFFAFLLAALFAFYGHLSRGGGFAAGVAGGTALVLVSLDAGTGAPGALVPQGGPGEGRKMRPSCFSCPFRVTLPCGGVLLPCRNLRSVLSGVDSPDQGVITRMVALGTWVIGMRFLDFRVAFLTLPSRGRADCRRRPAGVRGGERT
jgi:hypothetical protein